MLTNTQSIVSTIVFNQVCPPRLWWSEDITQVCIDGETLALDAFRSGIKRLLEKAWELYDSIAGKGNRFADNLPKNFKDDLLDNTNGYSFLADGPYTQAPGTLLDRIMRTCNLTLLDGEGRFSWDRMAVHALFATFDELNAILSMLTYILPCPSTRITEFLDHKLRNASRNRNLHMLGGEMFLLARYHKMTNITGYDICIPAFYPGVLQELTLEIFAGGLREVEIYLASVVFGSDAINNYSTLVRPSWPFSPPPPLKLWNTH